MGWVWHLGRFWWLTITEGFSMRLLKRNDLLGADGKKRRFAEFACPWNPEVGIRLRSLTAKEHAEFEQSSLTKSGGLMPERLKEAKRRLLAMTLVNEAGDLEMSVTDINAMEDTDGGLVNWAYGKALEHCRIKDSEVEELAKNSVAIESGSSPSDSPKN